MKVGFLINIMLLLFFFCTQFLIWLVDGTLVMTLLDLLDMESTVFTRSSAWNQYQTAVRNSVHNYCDQEPCDVSESILFYSKHKQNKPSVKPQK